MRSICLTILILLTLPSAHVLANDVPEQHLTLKDHVFLPRELTVPAGQKLKLIVTNEDTTNAEFESAELQREKVVAAHATITFFVGPLDPGTYPFYDDFHRDTTTGTIVAK